VLAVALVVASGLCGWGAARRLGWTLSWLEAAGLVGAIGLTASSWLSFLAAFALGPEVGLPVAIVALGAVGLVLARGRRLVLSDDARASWLSWIALGLVLALLFHGHMFHVERDGLYTGGASYGDLALHATLANHFATAPTTLQSPIVAGQALTYPFLGDFLVGMLVRGGLGLSLAFALTGWLSVMIGLGFVHAVAVRSSPSAGAGTIAVWLVVLSGSAVGILFAASDLHAHGAPAHLADLPNYSHMRARNVVFANLVSDFFLPQRALVAALPCFWAAVVAAQRGWRTDGRHAITVAGVAMGLLPMLHTHSFLYGIGLLVWLAIWRSVTMRAPAWAWWRAVAIALVLAAPQLAWQFGHSWQHGFGRWRLGWIAPRGQFWWFWLCNWGLALVLAPVALVHARRTPRSFALPLLLAALVVFAVANLYQFQPHDWDNMKFFVYAYMFVAIGLAGVLASGFAAGGLRRGASALVLVAMTATGALSLAREADRHDRLASTAELALATRLRSVLPVDARVLTSDQHNHVVPMLTGRAIVMGYRGWLWTYGIDYRELERDIGVIYAGRPGTEALLRQRGVTHVYIGPGERRSFHADAAWFGDHYRRVLLYGDVEVFDVRAPRALIGRR